MRRELYADLYAALQGILLQDTFFLLEASLVEIKVQLFYNE